MNLLYYKDSYLKECNAKIENIWEENDKNYVRVDNNIFYAQGGGQKGDKGYLIHNDETYEVINCIKDENGYPILITDVLLPKDLMNQEVRCKLNWDFRYTQMKLHTALHLLHCFIGEYYRKEIEYPISSNIEIDFEYNKYPQDIITEEVIHFVQKKYEDLLKQNIEVITYPDENKEMYRYWKCMEYIIPCGGVHVLKLNEINNVVINAHSKKGITTIKVSLA